MTPVAKNKTLCMLEKPQICEFLEFSKIYKYPAREE
jgi:hypothetical protein